MTTASGSPPIVVFKGGPLDMQEYPAVWQEHTGCYTSVYQFTLPIKNGGIGQLVYEITSGVRGTDHNAGGMMIARFQGVFEDCGELGRRKLSVPEAFPMPGERYNPELMGLEYASADQLVDQLAQRFQWIVVVYSRQHETPPEFKVHIHEGVNPMTVLGGINYVSTKMVNMPLKKIRMNPETGCYEEDECQEPGGFGYTQDDGNDDD